MTAAPRHSSGGTCGRRRPRPFVATKRWAGARCRCGRKLLVGQLPDLDRPFAGEPQEWTLDLVQLHCPPSDVIGSGRGLDNLDRLVQEGRIALRVSVETPRAGARGDGASPPRHRADHPERVPPQAAGRGAPGRRREGRGDHRAVPLALACCPAATPPRPCSRPRTTGTTIATARPSTSVRSLPGVDYDDGVRAAADFHGPVPRAGTSGGFAGPGGAALDHRPWGHDGDPGARNTDQARSNAEAAALPPLATSWTRPCGALRPLVPSAAVHHRW